MLVLAIDTATPYLVLGLPQSERVVRMDRRHAEALWENLEQFLQHSGVALSQLQGIAIGQGPGSYTGLRIGLSVGLGLARGLSIPLVGVGTLAAVAYRYQQNTTVAHSQRNGMAYVASFNANPHTFSPHKPPHKTSLSHLEVEGLLLVDQPPSGQALAKLGAQALLRGERGLSPVYL